MNKQTIRKSDGSCPYSPPLGVSVECDACRFYREDACRFVAMFSVGISEGKVESLEQIEEIEPRLTSDEAREVEECMREIEAFCFTEETTGLFELLYMKNGNVRMRCFKLSVSGAKLKKSKDIIIPRSLLESILDLVKAAQGDRYTRKMETTFSWSEVPE